LIGKNADENIILCFARVAQTKTIQMMCKFNLI